MPAETPFPECETRIVQIATAAPFSLLADDTTVDHELMGQLSLSSTGQFIETSRIPVVSMLSVVNHTPPLEMLAVLRSPSPRSGGSGEQEVRYKMRTASASRRRAPARRPNISQRGVWFTTESMLTTGCRLKSR